MQPEAARASGAVIAETGPETELAHRARIDRLAADLRAAGVGRVTRDVPLAPLVRWRIGGPADLLVDAAGTGDVAAALRLARQAGVPVFLLGDGSNMLIDSRGFRGLVLRIGRAMSALSVEGTRVQAGGGLWVPRLALELARRGLTGLEHVAGIPGTIGGLVLMNGGSQRKGVGTQVRRVTLVSPEGRVHEAGQEELEFSYRHSALQGRGVAITAVELELEPGEPAAIRRGMIAILAERRRKFPKNLPNCGSTFLSNPAMYATVGPPGRAIEEAGLKGVVIGGAQVSPLHANFIVNRGGATSDDVLALIAHIRATVAARTGYLMDCEARFLSAEGEEAPAHEFTDAGRFTPGPSARRDGSPISPA